MTSAVEVPIPSGGPLRQQGWHAWHSWLGGYDGVALVVLSLLPLAVLTACALAGRRRAAGHPPAWAWRSSLTEVGIVLGMLPSLWITLRPGSLAGAAPGPVSLVPLRDLQTMSTFQVVGNLLLLAALGCLVPLRFATLATLPRVLAVAATTSAVIETLQHVLLLDRVSSVDDVLLNTAGAGLAALLSRPWWRRRGTALRSARSTVDAPRRARDTEWST